MPRGKVYVIDDDEAMRHSLEFLLGSVDFEVALFGSAQAFLDAMPSLEFGCVVSDVRMPGIDGIELLRRLKTLQSRFPVIIMTGHGDVPMAVRAMKAGAFDFVEKPCNDQMLLDRIAEAIGQCRRNRDTAAERGAVLARYEQLTPREREVMTGIVAGRLNKLIADDLGVSVRTVEIHRAHIMEKMEARSLSALVRMALLIE